MKELFVFAVALLSAPELASSCARAPVAPSALTLESANPAAAPVGATVEIVGSGFAPTGNVVKLGPGYIGGLSSPDGRTLRFTIPDHHNVCPPAELKSDEPCADMYPAVMPGTYTLLVLTRDGRSRELTFTITER
jgi:hypothetical protein